MSKTYGKNNNWTDQNFWTNYFLNDIGYYDYYYCISRQFLVSQFQPNAMISPKVQELYLAQYEYDLQHDNWDKTKNNFLKKIVIDENAFRECNLVLWDEVRCGKNLQG